MERKSKELNLTPNAELIVPFEGGSLKYPTEAILTAQMSTLDKDGRFSKVSIGVGCKAFLFVLKKVE
jgi:hypothetical protein